jgi:hypothetical protein
MTLEQAIAHLRELAEEVPEPAALPTEFDISQVEDQLGITLHPDHRKFLLQAGDVVFGAMEPATVKDPDAHTHLPTIAEEAWDLGVPRKLLPICEDNGDYYCIDLKSGKIRFWSNDGVTEDNWPNLATWIEDVWIGENLDEDDENSDDEDDD